MYKNMLELLEERENNGWKLEKFEIKQGNFRAMIMVLCLGNILD